MALEILTVDQMYEADRLALEHVGSSFELMRNAAEAVLTTIQPRITSNTGIVVLCGHGNNGGDGLLVAQQLIIRGYAVKILFCGSDTQWSQLEGDARLAADICLQKSNAINFLADIAPSGIGEFLQQKISQKQSDLLVIDAILGAGLSRDVGEPIKSLITILNDARSPSNAEANHNDIDRSSLNVISIDLPSGINGDTGAVNGIALQADTTVSFFRKKPAHLLQPGKDYCGELIIAGIGIPASVLSSINTDIHANTPALWTNKLAIPHSGSHKYTRGHTLVASGPRYATGAARLAAMAALRAGCGVVTLASPGDAMDINAAHCTEIMLCQIDSVASLQQQLQQKQFNALVIGPGFGVGEHCRDLALAAIEACPVVVLDADAITSFSSDAGGSPNVLFNAIANNPATVVMTPHEGEFKRLFGDTPSATDAQGKLQQTRQAARSSGAIIVYKGADTVIASPCGQCVISDNGEVWLATAGSGDVLTGTIAGFMAQRQRHYSKPDAVAGDVPDPVDSLNSVAAAVWLHSEASAILGPGMIAGDLPGVYPQLLKEIYKAEH